MGGHSAVGNITLRILNDLATQDLGLKTQEHIQVSFVFNFLLLDGSQFWETGRHTKYKTKFVTIFSESLRLN